ncbi:YehR family protein, partial [Enterococcus faecalis]|nr:YehR family protein [Enterococcus faecalis]
STLTYTYQGDKVLTQTAKNIVSYDKLGITKEEAKTALEPVSKQYEDIKGLDYKLTYEDKQAIEKLTINYEKLDYDKAKKVDGIQIDGDSSKGISMKKSQELVESQGYTEQK